MKKINDKGFSLIEILVSLAIASIVLIGIFTIFNYTTKSYTTTKNKMTAQEEAEYASNYVYEILLEATDAKFTKSEIGSGLGGGRCDTFVVLTNEYQNDVNTGKLVAMEKKNFIVYDSDSKKMYFTSLVTNDTLTDDMISAQTKTINDDTKLLAENVSKFEVERIGKVLEGDPIKYTISISDGKEDFTVNNEACSRNSVAKTPAPSEEPTQKP